MTALLDFVSSGNMTVQMEMGITRLHPLPVLCSKVEWASSLSDSEFPLASKLVDLNGMNGLKYTSLRDIMPCSPTSVGSPRREGNWCSCTTISIKNDLVKHAACAYLQPMITESHNDDDLFVCCLSMFTNDGFLFSCFKDYIWTPINACIGFFTTRIFSNLSRTFGYLAGHLGGLFGVGVQKK